MDSYDDGQRGPYGSTGYALCGLLADKEGDNWADACDRRRSHPGGHTWELVMPAPPPPHGCLEDRVASLERHLKDLANSVGQMAGQVYGGGR